MTCCSSILSLPCLYSCDTIQIGINAPATGVYTIVLQPDGVKVVSTTNTAGSPLVFSGGYLNEDSTHVFKILKPDGTYLETEAGEDCFQLQVKPTSNATLANTTIAPLECECEYDIVLDAVLVDTVTLMACEDLTINIV